MTAEPPRPDATHDAGPSEFLRFLRTETWGGLLMLGAALVAIVWANSAWSSAYDDLRSVSFGPESLHLHLSLEAWVRDGLLAVFFFVVGLELKRELVVGELADRRTAAFPVAAALGGILVPALLAAAIMWGEAGAERAWAVPTATDIAFALAVLAIAGSKLPAGARVLLLALAVVDDLVAILLIAVLFSDGLDVAMLAGAAACAGAWAWLQHAGVRTWIPYVALFAGAWLFLHEAGVHPTIAGVALGLLTRVRARDGDVDDPPAIRVEHALQPWSAGLVVPVFAFTAAGVPLAPDDLRAAVEDPISLGILVGLVLGKWFGILAASWVVERVGIARRPDGVTWRMVNAIAVLGGIGFTVALLVADLALDGAVADHATAAVLLASTIAAVIGAVLLRTTVGRPSVTPN